jgi:hypothetical protein
MSARRLAALLLALPTALAAQQAADRIEPPSLGPTAPLVLPRVDERRLANGLTVLIVESREVPLVQLRRDARRRRRRAQRARDRR